MTGVQIMGPQDHQNSAYGDHCKHQEIGIVFGSEQGFVCGETNLRQKTQDGALFDLQIKFKKPSGQDEAGYLAQDEGTSRDNGFVYQLNNGFGEHNSIIANLGEVDAGGAFW